MMGLKQGKARDNYKPNNEMYTPAFIFEALDITFDLDVCAPVDGSLVPSKHKFSLPTDGLLQEWFGLIWMNPPYSQTTPWVEKWLNHRNGLALLPMMKSKWFKNLWQSDAAICDLPVNLKFERPDGTSRPIFSPCLLAALGDQSITALEKSQLGKVR